MSGLRLIKDKCLFRKTNLKFLGHIFTTDGIVADLEKIAAILDIPAPATVLISRQVMGMVHFLRSYLPGIHSVSRPLSDLLKDDIVWAWGPAQKEAFVKMKMLVAPTPIVAYYDATKSTCVSADASF